MLYQKLTFPKLENFLGMIGYVKEKTRYVVISTGNVFCWKQNEYFRSCGLDRSDIFKTKSREESDCKNDLFWKFITRVTKDNLLSWNWRRNWTYGRAPNAIDISYGSLTCPSYTDTGPPFLYGYSEKPPHLVAFSDTLGIRRTNSRLESHGVLTGDTVTSYSSHILGSVVISI